MKPIARLPQFWRQHLLFLAALAIAVLITWKIIHQANLNWGLDQQAAEIRARSDLLEQSIKNQTLENEFFRSDYYVDLAVREQQGYLLPEENVLIIDSEKIARLKDEYRPPLAEESETAGETSNLERWWRFVLGLGPDDERLP